MTSETAPPLWQPPSPRQEEEPSFRSAEVTPLEKGSQPVRVTAVEDPETVERELLALADHAILGLPAPARARRTQKPSETGQAPSFQVTIGRLEVVAPPPAVKPARRSGGTRTSLKDYLDRRRMGR